MGSPVGQAWTATLELVGSKGMPRSGQVDPLVTSTPAGVERAAELAATMPLGSLLRVAVLGTDSISPWYDTTRPDPVFAHAAARRAIAEAIAARPDIDQLFRPGTATQWFWNDGGWLDRRLGKWLDSNSSSNWFPSTGTIATCSPLPDDWPSFDAPVHEGWDLCFGPVSRWEVDVDQNARIHQIDEPDDWIELVEQFPLISAVDAEVRADLRSVGWHDAGEWQRCLVPDWAAVAEVYDGVHLSWAGFIRVDGLPISLGDKDMTLMRRWDAERTVWLTPVLVDPRPLPVDPDQLDPVLAPEDPRWHTERAQWKLCLGRGASAL